ncbi:MAG: protoporphyrinogen oxidase, partial [Verrucomicrobia bacterium]|nr:protoporphyrinogen oxidase [Verrucomicrobiota bacterium]
MTTQILILGGGITGLSAAWFLKKQNPYAQIVLLEKESRLGGWIRTSQDGGFFFEKGPRTFQASRSPHLLALIQELPLEIVPSDPQAAKRYILYKGVLRSPVSFLPQWIPVLIRELFIAKGQKEDESIYDFAVRRFSRRMAELFFDPLTLGIYAGDMRTLSIRSCFPTLYQWEQQKGSILRGLFSLPKKTGGLFTLKGGMESLIVALERQLHIDIVLNCPVEHIGQNEVYAGGKRWAAQKILSALPPALPSRSIWVVNLAFEGDVLSRKGFGYLVPSQEKESILGVVFDSAIFPEQGAKNQTRLTVMVRAEEAEPLAAALSALRRHLNLVYPPIYSSC